MDKRRVDASRLDEIIRQNYRRLYEALWPLAKRIGNELRIGNVYGVAGESLGVQLTGDKAGLWHDRATDEGGKFLKALMACHKLNFLDAVGWIERTLGVDLRGPEPASGKKESEQRQGAGVQSVGPFDWPSCVAALSERHLKGLAEARGYSLPFCWWLKRKAIIGLYDGHLAFPVADSSGAIVGCHYLYKKGEWRYTRGCKVVPLVIGDLATSRQAHVFESYWDCFAFADTMGLHQDNDDDGTALIVTRGAANGKAVQGLLSANPSYEVFVWPQRDTPRDDGTIPSQLWLAAVIGHAGRPVRVAWIPDSHPEQDFDLNDWTREGASGFDLAKAMKIAEVHEQKEPIAFGGAYGGNGGNAQAEAINWDENPPNPPIHPKAPTQRAEGQREVLKAEKSEEDLRKERLEAFRRAVAKGQELLDIEIPGRAIIFDDWFKESDLGFLFAPRGVGKTWLANSLCVALAEGSEFGPWTVEGKWPVLYVDGEMPLEDDKSRLHGLNDGRIPDNLHVLNHEALFHREGLVMNLANKVDQEILTSLCLERDIKVLVLDNLGCLFTGVSENDADDWEKVLPWLLELRRRRIAVVVIHHTGHDPSRMRGTSKREDSAAWVLRLDDKKADFGEAGALFVSRFRKNRGKKVALDYEWSFAPNGENGVLVTFKEASRADLVIQWVADGLTSCEDIAKEMGLSKGAVSKIAMQLIKDGKLRKNGRNYALVE